MSSATETTVSARPDGLPDFVQPGALVSWRTWCRDYVTVQVWSVDRFRVHYQWADGVLGYVEEAMFSTVADSVCDPRHPWRPATAEEAERFRAHARPWKPVE